METGTSDKIYQETFDGIEFFYRDTTLPDELISKYTAGQIIMERGFVDMSHKSGGIAGNLRYLVATAHGKDISKLSPDASRYGHVILSNNAVFKVLDIIRKNRKTQILLLEIPSNAIDLFTHVTADFEKVLITNAREIFEHMLPLPVSHELNTLDWRERTEFPIGMDSSGDFFYKG